MEEEYLEGIYKEEELQAGPDAAVVILLPLNYQPDKEEITMLDRLLTAMGFTAGDRRFAYHQGRPEKQHIWEENVKILFFTENPATEPALMKDEIKGLEWFNLPPLGTINQEIEIKKRVWSLLKN
jgi:hypothetical protein